jgi:hypothetical protein
LTGQAPRSDCLRLGWQRTSARLRAFVLAEEVEVVEVDVAVFIVLPHGGDGEGRLDLAIPLNGHFHEIDGLMGEGIIGGEVFGNGGGGEDLAAFEGLEIIAGLELDGAVVGVGVFCKEDFKGGSSEQPFSEATDRVCGVWHGIGVGPVRGWEKSGQNERRKEGGRFGEVRERKRGGWEPPGFG